MFAEWTSLSPIIAANSNGAQSQSVLNKFSGPAGREVTIAVVKQLAGNLGLTQPAEPSSLTKDEEVSPLGVLSIFFPQSFHRKLPSRYYGAWTSFVMDYHYHCMIMKPFEIV